MSLTAVNDIIAGMKTEISTALGASYQELPYVNDVSKNNFRTNAKRYGVRALASEETSTVTKRLTLIHTFEVILTDLYYESNIDDSPLETAKQNLFEQMLRIYQQLDTTKAGTPGVVLNVTNLNTLTPEILVEEKVVVLRAEIDILYRINL